MKILSPGGKLISGLMSATSRPFEDNLDQDQTVQIVLSDLRSTLSDDEIIKFQNNFEIAFAIDLILSFNLIISVYK